MAIFPGVPGYTRVVSITIPSTRNGGQERSALMSVSNDNIEEEFLMFKGKWTVTVACDSPYLLMVSEFEMWLVYFKCGCVYSNGWCIQNCWYIQNGWCIQIITDPVIYICETLQTISIIVQFTN